MNSASTSVPIQLVSTFAAVRATPCWMTAGNVTPTGSSPDAAPNSATMWATTSATALGVDGCGVAIRRRSSVNSPATRSTGAPLMPDPPMSIPNPGP